MPHARIPGIDSPLTLLLRAQNPIEFKAPDHQPVRLMLAILVPEGGDRDDHLQLLALVAELFSQPRLRALMDTGVDPEAVSASFAAGVAQVLAG